VKKFNFDAKSVALLSVLTAVTAALTLAVRIPFAPTRGYITLADVGVYFAAFALGPVAGFIAGGIGTGLADAIAGYPQWMVFSFFIHGVQGLVAGLIGYKTGLPRMILGFAVGMLLMVLGYFAAGSLLYGIGAAAAEVPLNICQNAAGGIVGIPLVLAVRRAYPPINTIGQARAWEQQE
jgi:uncharacterized membrane protein